MAEKKKKIPVKKAPVKKSQAKSEPKRLEYKQDTPNDPKDKPRGNPNRANPPKQINAGHTPGSASRAVVPYKAPAPSKLKTGLKAVAKTALKAAGPVGLIAGIVSGSKPAGAGSDKPSGPLMKGNKPKDSGKGNPKTVNPQVPRTRKDSKPPAAGLSNPLASALGAAGKKAATPAPKPRAKPASEAPKPTARPMKKASASAPAYTPEKAQKRGNVTSGFSGNWQGAAPSEMQKRGGAKINRGGGLLGKLRKK